MTKTSVLEAVYPVGSIYMTINSTNPGTVFGFGTWELWGSGRVPVCVNTSDSNFNSVEKTGGSAELCQHSHSIPKLSGSAALAGAHAHNLKHSAGLEVSKGSGYWVPFEIANYNEWVTLSAGAHTHSVTTNASNTGMQGTGDSGNLQPYITCYMWKRTK